MQDVLTETPPPSRFLEEDLDNFAPRSPPLPSPFLLLKNPNPNSQFLHSSLLLIAISPASLSLLHRIPNKTLIGTLILPELPLSSNSLHPSPLDASITLFSAGPAVLVAVQCRVADDRSRAVAKTLFSQLRPEKVVILDSIKGGNHRGRLAVDEAMVFKLETAEERKAGGSIAKGVEYLPSGSVMDGLGAAVIGECAIRGWRGTVVATWPESGRTVAAVLRDLVKDLGLDVEGFGYEGGNGGTDRASSSTFALYT